MKLRTAFLWTSGSFLLGVVLGFLFSPIKQGIHVEVCNNGSEIGEEALKKAQAA
ncbi:hypothetical protein [Acidaminobacterium chupaoyuni]